MRVIALDPGPSETAYVLMADGNPSVFAKVPNERMLEILERNSLDAEWCCLEMVACYGMPVGAEVFETCVAVGAFMHAFGADRAHRLTRMQVKNHLCHSSRATDATVRQALIDRFGGKAAIGKKANPGVLYKLAGDCWSALAVGCVFFDQQRGFCAEDLRLPIRQREVGAADSERS